MSYVSAENSKLLYGTQRRVAADGTHAGVVKVVLRDHACKPVSGRRVELLADREDVTIIQPPLTNDAGLALGYVRTSTAGPVVITGRVIPVNTP